MENKINNNTQELLEFKESTLFRHSSNNVEWKGKGDFFKKLTVYTQPSKPIPTLQVLYKNTNVKK